MCEACAQEDLRRRVDELEARLKEERKIAMEAEAEATAARKKRDEYQKLCEKFTGQSEKYEKRIAETIDELDDEIQLHRNTQVQLMESKKRINYLEEESIKLLSDSSATSSANADLLKELKVSRRTYLKYERWIEKAKSWLDSFILESSDYEGSLEIRDKLKQIILILQGEKP
jgi:chromosome segregation ATPase